MLEGERMISSQEVQVTTDSIPISVSDQFLRRMIESSQGKLPFLKFSMLNEKCSVLVTELLTKGTTMPLGNLFRTSPFLVEYYEPNSLAATVKLEHEVMKAIDMLQAFFAQSPSGLCYFDMCGFTALTFGCGVESGRMRRCTVSVQKRLLKLFSSNIRIVVTRADYCSAFVSPTRFLNILEKSFCALSELNLNEILPQKGLRLLQHVFPQLLSLTDFIWHRADGRFIAALPNALRLRSVCLTFLKSSIDTESMALLCNLQNVEELYTGFLIPCQPTPFDIDVLLRSYQTFWTTRTYCPNETIIDQPIDVLDPSFASDLALRAFPKIKKLAFWNAPETIFLQLEVLNIPVDELQFGQLSQDFSRLCTIDSVLQALFEVEENGLKQLHCRVSRLKLYLQSMPVINLSYYLPHILDRLAQVLPELEILEIFVHCTFNNAMDGPWTLEDRTCTSKFAKIRQFSLIVDGLCYMDDLHKYFPATLQKVELSVVLPPKKSLNNAFMLSFNDFVGMLSNKNNFPVFQELVIQVNGVRCFDAIRRSVLDNFPSIKKLSIVAMPEFEDRDSVMHAISMVVMELKDLTFFGISAEFLKIALTENDVNRKDWENMLASLRSRFGIKGIHPEFAIVSLPFKSDSWNQLFIRPHWVNPEDFEEDENEVASLSSDSESTDDDGESDSFIRSEIEFASDDSSEWLELERRVEENERMSPAKSDIAPGHDHEVEQFGDSLNCLNDSLADSLNDSLNGPNADNNSNSSGHVAYTEDVEMSDIASGHDHEVEQFGDSLEDSLNDSLADSLNDSLNGSNADSNSNSSGDGHVADTEDVEMVVDVYSVEARSRKYPKKVIVYRPPDTDFAKTESLTSLTSHILSDESDSN